MYAREMKERLLALSEKWPIISVTGPRQSGKTTLCKYTFPFYDYVNLEDVTLRDFVGRDIKSFLLSHPNGLIIDEAQNLPPLFSALQVVVDENKSLRYVLSGSSDFLLMQSISQSLAGRIATERLLPLSLSELSETDKEDTDRLMLNGFYPGVWGDGKEASDVYGNYMTTYIQRDVRLIENIRNLSDFQRFMVLCAARVGTDFNASSLADETGMSYKTIQSWMSVLEASFTAFLLQPYYRNIGKRLVKMPKLYFYDVGLACHLLGIQTKEQLQYHPQRGALFENMVICDRLKSRFNQGLSNNLFFYRDKSGHEVDLVQEQGLRLDACEIKSAKRYNSEFHRNLDYFKSLYGADVHSMTVVYDGREELAEGNDRILNFRHF